MPRISLLQPPSPPFIVFAENHPSHKQPPYLQEYETRSVFLGNVKKIPRSHKKTDGEADYFIDRVDCFPDVHPLLPNNHAERKIVIRMASAGWNMFHTAHRQTMIARNFQTMGSPLFVRTCFGLYYSSGKLSRQYSSEPNLISKAVGYGMSCISPLLACRT